MLTNFQTLKKQIRRLRELEQGAADGDFENYTKKEKLLFERERVKLSRNLEGIKLMGRLPGALFVVDAKKEKIAVAEANKLGIPVVAIVDTNADPDVITVPVPGQRRRHPLGLPDHRRAVGRDQGGPPQMPMREVSEDLEAETYSTDAGSEGDSEPIASAAGRAGSAGRSRRPSRPGSRPTPTGAEAAARARRAKAPRPRDPCARSERSEGQVVPPLLAASVRADAAAALLFTPDCTGWRLWRARRFPRRTSASSGSGPAPA